MPGPGDDTQDTRVPSVRVVVEIPGLPEELQRSYTVLATIDITATDGRAGSRPNQPATANDGRADSQPHQPAEEPRPKRLRRSGAFEVSGETSPHTSTTDEPAAADVAPTELPAECPSGPGNSQALATGLPPAGLPPAPEVAGNSQALATGLPPAPEVAGNSQARASSADWQDENMSESEFVRVWS